MEYGDFIERLRHVGADNGFEPHFLPDALYPFQHDLTEWAIRKGRAAIFADCGLGKTPMQLVWADNVVRKTGRPVLVFTPLAVSQQLVGEGEKFGFPVSRDISAGGIITMNYQRLHHAPDPATLGGVVLDESSILKSLMAQRGRMSRTTCARSHIGFSVPRPQHRTTIRNWVLPVKPSDTSGTWICSVDSSVRFRAGIWPAPRIRRGGQVAIQGPCGTTVLEVGLFVGTRDT